MQCLKGDPLCLSAIVEHVEEQRQSCKFCNVATGLWKACNMDIYTLFVLLSVVAITQSATITELQGPQAPPLPVSGFIRPEFNIVLILAFYILSYYQKKNSINFHWIIDVLSSACILYAAYSSRSILFSNLPLQKAASSPGAQTIDVNMVNSFLILLLLSWVAMLIFEARSCIYLIINVRPANYNVYNLRGRRYLKLAITLVFGANSLFVAMNSCISELKTFEYLTDDPMVYVYFTVHAVMRIVRAFIQGVVFSSRVTSQPWQFVRPWETEGRRAMRRMAFANMVILSQTIVVCWFAPLNIRTPLELVLMVTLLLDMCYQLVCFSWHVYNSDSVCAFFRGLWRFFTELCYNRIEHNGYVGTSVDTGLKRSALVTRGSGVWDDHLHVMLKSQNTVLSELQIRRILNPQRPAKLVSGRLKLPLRESVSLHDKHKETSDIEPGLVHGNLPLHQYHFQ